MTGGYTKICSKERSFKSDLVNEGEELQEPGQFGESSTNGNAKGNNAESGNSESVHNHKDGENC